MEGLDKELDIRINYVNDVLKKYAVLPEEGYQKTVLSAMNYSLLAGGKRLRPILMSETYKMFGGSEPGFIEPFMAAIEVIHTYSLVHDDLPAMDDDELRRGKKTTHVVYGEDMAILAGDALLNRAFELCNLAFDQVDDKDPERAVVEYKRIVKATAVLSSKSGIYGMVGGQTFDVEAEDKKLKLSEEQLLFIFRLKTAALIEASMVSGALLAGASDEDAENVENIAMNIGLAFQIQDDILDVTGSDEVLGKTVGSDEKNNKITYVTIKGIDEARRDVRTYSDLAIESLEAMDLKNPFLLELIRSLITREK